MPRSPLQQRQKPLQVNLCKKQHIFISLSYKTEIKPNTKRTLKRSEQSTRLTTETNATGNPEVCQKHQLKKRKLRMRENKQEEVSGIQFSQQDE